MQRFNQKYRSFLSKIIYEKNCSKYSSERNRVLLNSGEDWGRILREKSVNDKGDVTGRNYQLYKHEKLFIEYRHVYICGIWLSLSCGFQGTHDVLYTYKRVNSPWKPGYS